MSSEREKKKRKICEIIVEKFKANKKLPNGFLTELSKYRKLIFIEFELAS